MATAQEKADIAQLYSEYLGRAPDPSGLDYWSGLLGGGESLSNIEQAFATSKEAQTYAAAEEADRAANEALVSGYYGDVLGRDADTAGLDYWTDQLTSGNIDQAGLLGEFNKAATMGEDAYKTQSLQNIANLYGVDTAGAQSIYDVWPTTTKEAIAPATTTPAVTTQQAIQNAIAAGGGTVPGGASGGSQTYYNVIPFGSTYAGGNIYTPGFLDDAAYAPTIQNAFEQQMLYQSQLPNLIPQFDINAISPIVTQTISPGTRFDIGQTVVPDWLRVETPAEARKLATGKSIADIQREDAAKQTQADEQAAQYADNY